jgi:hypothetical protein
MKWSECLIKRRVDEFLFDPEPSDTVDGLAQLAELRGLCGEELTSPQSCAGLRAALKDFTAARRPSKRVRAVLAEVREALREISSDLRFAASARGRFVLFCNDYVQELYKTVRVRADFADVSAGAHISREALVVSGHVRDEGVLGELRAILDAQPPGVEVIWRVTFGLPH